MDARECYIKSCKIEPYNMVEEKKNKAPISIIKVVVTTLEDLYPRSDFEDWRPNLNEDIETFQICRESHMWTKIDKRMEDLVQNEVEQLLFGNADLFAWSASDRPGIDPNFIFHKLSIFPKAKPIAQRKCKLREEKRKVVEA